MMHFPSQPAHRKQTSVLVYREQWVTIRAQITYTRGKDYDDFEASTGGLR
jgi:hypothetical protein